MVRVTKFVGLFLRLALFALLTRLFSLAGIRIGHIVGSRAAFFSGGSVMTPLAGLFGSVFECGLLSVANAFFVFFSGAATSHVFTFGIPSFFAALYWAKPSFWTRLVVPIVCMVLFGLHPIGYEALPYTFYWFIPMALYLFRRDTIFSNALGSTFVQHAVGSVIWLYSTPTTPAMWLSLIPEVARERLLIAGWMLCVYAAALLAYRTWCHIQRYIPRMTSISDAFKGVSE